MKTPPRKCPIFRRGEHAMKANIRKAKMNVLIKSKKKSDEVPEISMRQCQKCMGKNINIFRIIGTGDYSVWCADCGARTVDYKTEKEAVDAWNNGITMNRKQRRTKRKNNERINKNT